MDAPSALEQTIVLKPLIERDAAMKRPSSVLLPTRALAAAMKKLLAGNSLEMVARFYGFPSEVLREAWLEHLEKGMASPHDQGRGATARRKLTQDQEAELSVAIQSAAPDQLGLRSKLWDRDCVKQLVKDRTGIELPSRTLSTYLERWGYAPEKPLQAYHRNHPSTMQTWIKRDYPVIAMLARESGSLVHWWGITRLLPRMSGASANELVQAMASTPGMLNAVFATTNRGQLRWLVHKGALRMEDLIDFFERLLVDAGALVHIIVDNRPFLNDPRFLEWKLRNRDRIEFHVVPLPAQRWIMPDTAG
ncbi:MAG: winged helix-turn-helix domain-containing protein [Flavobacteriales bacterium]|jgi:transposase|nr:winged helix-turn-helix domain-containing protein [Flavobacteriales bacterium]